MTYGHAGFNDRIGPAADMQAPIAASHYVVQGILNANNRHGVASLNETPTRNQPVFDDAFRKDTGCPEFGRHSYGVGEVEQFFHDVRSESRQAKNITALSLPTLRQIKALSGFS